ncbi:carboxypeptidase-like regulatory domain-containing protein [Ichthyenterobacterium magnum]|uniref:Carboxypeptidase-like protein n=1 Tax=Ichthyenterobacterium magnum TaxID=1230530 RepID=A0A420DM61_9FLAO|nr:carboxypeptidase-like regulatory domain-containing protein [Ichthyenterobacterium magnum]RKE95285.1 carboxypeptidase-like protein [Ichthyenterobacterium magnum]
MKNQSTFTPKKSLRALGYVAFLMMTILAFNPVYGQSKTTLQNERTIKGVISNDDGPLESASIVLKGTKIGTSSNSKGEFIFPKPLKTGDVLLISYLGYETVEMKIKADTGFIRLRLSEDLLEFVGALNSDKPYKSKRSNK